MKLGVVVLMGVAWPMLAWAQPEAIKARKDNFHMLSDQVRDLVKGLGDGVPVSTMRDRALGASQSLERVAGLFPAASAEGDTKARAVIWSEPERFKAVYAAATERMAELVVAAGQPDRDAFGAAVGRMAAACGACHVAFRAD